MNTTTILILVAAAIVGALLLLPNDKPMVTVHTEDVTVRVTAPAEVVILPGQPATVAIVPVSGTNVPATGMKLPAWLGSPFARYALYGLAGCVSVLALQFIKRRSGWQGEKMLRAAVCVIGALGLLITYLVQDKGLSALVSNPFNLGGGIGFAYMVANLAYQRYFKK